MKALVLYYSFEGYTKALAEVIAGAVDADIEGIHPVHELKSHGFSKYIWGGRQAVMGKTPEIEPLKLTIRNYDLVFIGCPVWAFTYAPPIKTLIQSGILEGMPLAFFCSHDGGPGKTVDKFKKLIKEEHKFVDGITFLNGGENILHHHKNAVSWAIKCMENMV